MSKTAADPMYARLRDAAVLLPAIGVFLLMPPAINLFTGTRAVAGVPLIVVYLFGVWLALIVCAALLARRLAPPPAPAAAPPGEAPATDPAG
ncbi:MAG: hypothetical protein AMXMBFR66_34030 [Pseudomonadota bacterium]|nr:hypothetical protein [Rubrivivax sp.]NLZ42135.1 hypothetical protein [Comamonadaceae bacterium]